MSDAPTLSPVHPEQPTEHALHPDPPSAETRELLVALGLPLLPAGPAYTAAMLTSAMHGDGLACRMFVPADRWDGAPLGVPVVSAVGAGARRNRFAGKIFARYRQLPVMARLTRLLMDHVDQTRSRPMAWMFSEVPMDLLQRLNRAGIPIVREKINCSKFTARRIMLAEHERIGLPPFTAVSEANLEQEAEEMALVDAVFCPSPMVRLSLLEIGIAEEKLLPTSYGWEPARLAGTSRALPPIDGITLVFAGQVGIRKGAHILLEAWARAKIPGRLVLAGRIDPVIAKRYGHLLEQPGVVLPGYVEDIGALYRSADWFIFPTLEEGGPQVTYEAGGCGTPSLVSPMGAGAFTRHGVDGIVLDSVQEEEWAALIASLPARREERDRMAASALQRADQFTWDRVGAQRRAQLLAKFR